MRVLLTGGAGYIGSHVLRALRAAGHEPVVYDNFSRGHREAVADAKIIEADTGDYGTLATVLHGERIEAVIHLAAFIEAGESVERPAKYFANNTFHSLQLLNAMRDTGVRRLVFSSTAAVYGQPRRVPIDESEPTEPINPYGASKLATEFMIRAFCEAHGLEAICLRYFNVAGAHPDGDIGEDHSPETHLIPLVLQVAMGRREKIFIFGEDYDTADGTCVRDYIHVCDLADAHVSALERLQPGRPRVCNLGNGEGFSVRQVIEAARQVTGEAIPAEIAPRRPGDPAKLVASARGAGDILGWRPRYADLETIIAHAWAWHRSHPDGYGG